MGKIGRHAIWKRARYTEGSDHPRSHWLAEFAPRFPSDRRRILLLNRRHALQTGLAAGFLSAASRNTRAQAKPLTKVRYSEVNHSVFFAPVYVAMGKGFFTDVGLDVAMTTAYGGDKAMAALLGGSADIALIGPDVAIFVLISDSSLKARVFCGLNATDGFMLVGREKVDKFEWSMLKGTDVLGFRPASTPLLFFEAAMRKNGIDPDKDVKLTNNIGIPARMGSWLAGQNQYAIFDEPAASQLEHDGKGWILASIGQTVGFVDYTMFAATDKTINDNPRMLQAWTDAIARALIWTAEAPAGEVAQIVSTQFPGVDMAVLTAAVDRYRRLKVWKSTPVIEPVAIDRFQDILVGGRVLDPTKRVKFADLVRTEFAGKAP
jgi:NitT/TauT family transport system substrate-binding protein